MSPFNRSKVAPSALGRVLRRWCGDTSGVTAVEFGMVGVPFMMMCFGVITIGLHFLTTYSLENSVERAGRLIRTGQAQSSGMTANEFKNVVCDNAASFIDCGNKMRVHIESWGNFVDVNPKGCLDNSGNLAASGNGSDPVANSSGGASAVVVVTVCYEWDMAGKLPFLHLGKMANGASLIQAATTFRTEPYQ